MSLSLVLRFRGPDLVPAEVTRITGVEPSRSFLVGEARGASRDLAGWEWASDVATDTDRLFDDMLGLFRSSAPALRAVLGGQTQVWLTVRGHVGGLVVSSPEQAEQRRIDWGEHRGVPFTPFFDGDRVDFYLSPEVVAFLATIGASVGTHIDFELDDEHPNWWEKS